MLDQASLETLPNPGRNPFVLSRIAPTVIPTGSPQFGNVRAHRVTASRSRYDAFVISAERRQLDRWGARLNCVYSVLKDNQSGEENSFTNNVQAVIDSFDLEREFFYQSGFPVAIIQSSNVAGTVGFGQRPNVVAGVDPC